MPATNRVYAGRTAADRQAERRARLLAAALDMWSDQGWAGVTVRGVCARARLSERYFYESFADRDALLLATFDEALAEAVSAVLEAVTQAPHSFEVKIRAAIASFVHALVADPRKARIGLVEPAGSPALEQRRRAAFTRFAELVAEHARQARSLAGIEPWQHELSARFCVGGLAELISQWLDGSLPVDEEALVAHGTALFVEALDRPRPGGHDSRRHHHA